MARARKKKRAPQPEAVEGNTPICFVIMPFGGWSDVYYEKIYFPAIEAADLVPVRADDIYRPSQIINDIWKYTKQAVVLLADLTGRNPNVMYELGLAHAIGRPAVIISESIEDVPFDLRALRVISYDKNLPSWSEELGEAICTALKETLAAPKAAVLPTFLEATPERPTTSALEKELLEIRSDLQKLKQSPPHRLFGGSAILGGLGTMGAGSTGAGILSTLTSGAAASGELPQPTRPPPTAKLSGETSTSYTRRRVRESATHGDIVSGLMTNYAMTRQNALDTVKRVQRTIASQALVAQRFRALSEARQLLKQSTSVEDLPQKLTDLGHSAEVIKWVLHMLSKEEKNPQDDST